MLGWSALSIRAAGSVFGSELRARVSSWLERGDSDIWTAAEARISCHLIPVWLTISAYQQLYSTPLRGGLPKNRAFAPISGDPWIHILRPRYQRREPNFSPKIDIACKLWLKLLGFILTAVEKFIFFSLHNIFQALQKSSGAEEGFNGFFFVHFHSCPSCCRG